MSRVRVVPVIAGTALSGGVVFGLLRYKLRDGFFHERIVLEHQLPDHAEVIACQERKEKESSQRKKSTPLQYDTPYSRGHETQKTEYGQGSQEALINHDKLLSETEGIGKYC